MAAEAIVIARAWLPVVSRLLCGIALTMVGLVIATTEVEIVVVAPMIVVGLAFVYVNGRMLLTRAPRLRADHRGVWFGGGASIPWRDIKAIYSAGLDLRINGVKGRTESIAFDFHKRSTRFRIPISAWLIAPFGIGDIDVSPHDSSARTDVLVAKLDAMRIAAVGHVDGVVAGAGALPDARIVERP